MLDSGAECSVNDIGTVTKIELVSQINKMDFNLIDASGNQMNIIGTVTIEVELENLKPYIYIYMHEFKVLDSKTYNNVLLGRDFMKRFGSVKFDFVKNKIQIGNVWLNSLSIQNKERVKLKENTTLQARFEQVVLVK